MKTHKFSHRIMMTVDTVGGVWTYALELSRGLAAEGAEVLLATLGPRMSDGQRSEVGAIPGVSVVESEYALEWMPDPWADVRRSGDWLLQVADLFEPDIVHLNGYSHAALPWTVPTVVVAHSCVLSWWRAVRGGGAGPEWDTYRENVQRGIEAADHIIAPTAWMLRELEDFYGVLGDPRVIANGRSIRLPDAIRNEPVILTVGRLWDEAKNARAIAEVAGDLEWPVWLAGDTTSPDGQSGTFSKVKLLGRRSPLDVIVLCQRASIFALPARYEPFGLSALEAALCDCALVLGDIPSLREVWGDAALYVDPEDRGGLRSTLNSLSENAGQLASYAHAAKVRARLYSVEAMTRAYIESYRTLMARGRKNVARYASYS